MSAIHRIGAVANRGAALYYGSPSPFEAKVCEPRHKLTVYLIKFNDTARSLENDIRFKQNLLFLFLF